VGNRFLNPRTDERGVDGHGYPWVRVDGVVRAEHRVVMEKKLGRSLKKGESVHHKDGNRTNNDPDNLELWVGAIRWGQRAVDITCPHCGQAYGL
jgi:hypothetical protein